MLFERNSFKDTKSATQLCHDLLLVGNMTDGVCAAARASQSEPLSGSLNLKYKFQAALGSAH